MQQISNNDPHAVHDSLNSAALHAMVQFGAAKIQGLIGPESIDRIKEKAEIYAIPRDMVGLIAIAPELAALPSHLDAHPDDSRFTAGDVRRYKRERGDEDSHIDEVVINGLTLLFAISGPEAWFGASNRPFRGEHNPPFVTSYEPGDGILLRQRVSSVNGVRRRLQQMSHLGICSTGHRWLGYIDFEEPKLTIVDLPAATTATTASSTGGATAKTA